MKKIKDFFKNITPLEYICSVASSIIFASILLFLNSSQSDGLFRFVTIAITILYFFAATLNSKFLLEKLKKVHVSDPKNLQKIKISWKIHAEHLSLIGLLGFAVTQYRIGAEIDQFMTGIKVVSHYDALIQAAALIGLLLTAALAVSRKLALAKFELFENDLKELKNKENSNSEKESIAQSNFYDNNAGKIIENKGKYTPAASMKHESPAVRFIGVVLIILLFKKYLKIKSSFDKKR